MKKKICGKRVIFLISCLLLYCLFMRAEAAAGDGGTVTAISLKGEQSFTFKPASGFTGDEMTANIKEAKLEDGKIVFIMESLPEYSWQIARTDVSDFFNITIEGGNGVSFPSDKLYLQVVNPNSIKLYVKNALKLVSNDVEFRAETGGSAYDKKYPSITELLPKGDLRVQGGASVGVRSFRFEPEYISEDKLQDSRVYAGKVVIEPEEAIGGIAAEYMDFSMAAAYEKPENGEYTKVSVNSNLRWSVGKPSPDLELTATRTDGSQQVFYYTVQLLSDQYLTETDGWLISKPFDIMDVLNLREYRYEEKDNRIVFAKKPGLTSIYDVKGENYKIYPQYALGARAGKGAAEDGSFSGNLYEGFDFEIINGKGESRIWHIQAETLLPLEITNYGHKSHSLKVFTIADGSEQEAECTGMGGADGDGSSTSSYGNMMPGVKVTVHITPEEKDQGKILDPAEVRVLDGSRQPLSGVTILGNTVIFTMPEGKVILEHLRYKEDDRTSYGVQTAARLTDGRTTSGLAVSHTVQAGEGEAVANQPDAYEGDTVTLTAAVPEHDYYHYEFDHWDYGGDDSLKAAAKETVSDDGKTYTTAFSMPAGAVSVTAYYRLEGAQVTLGVSNSLSGSMDAWMGKALVTTVETAAETDTYKEGGLTLELSNFKQDQYRFRGFSMDGALLDPDSSGGGITWAGKKTNGYLYQSPTIPLTGGQKVTFMAEFAMIQNGRITAVSSDEAMGTVEVLVDGNPLSKDTFVNEGTRITLKAEPKTGYLFSEWKVASPAQDHGVVFEDPAKAETAFLMPEKGGDITVQGCFAVDPSYKSSACEMTGAFLLNAEGETVREADRSGRTFTIALNAADLTPEEADRLNAGSYFLKLETSPKSSTAMKGGHDDRDSDMKWSEGKVICPLGRNESGEFTVTAEDGTTGKTYTVTIRYTEPEPEKPVLSAKGVSRTSEKDAEVKFASSLDGKCYFSVAEHGAPAPSVNTSGASTLSVKKGVTGTITLTTLSAGAKDLYVVVKSKDAVSDPLKIEIPAYVPAEKTYKIGLSYPAAGGTLTVSSTEAKAGERITVTVTPKSGKRLTAGSLRYTESTAGGAVVNIDETTKTFVMPAGDISVSCTWEDDGGSGPDNPANPDNPVNPDNPANPDNPDPPASDPGAQPKSEELWNRMLNEMGASTDSSGSSTWWEKAKRSKRHDSFPSYW